MTFFLVEGRRKCTESNVIRDVMNLLAWTDFSQKKVNQFLIIDFI